MNGRQAIRLGLESKRVTPSRQTIASNYMFVLGRESAQSPTGNFIGTDQNYRRVTRRPFGLEFNDDRYAYIEVLREVTTGLTTQLVPLALFNENHPVTQYGTPSTSPRGAAVANYANNFIIQSAQEVREEKFQILETFGDDFVFFFGERPRFFDVSGMLLNANSHRWKREWWLNYDSFLRGTKAVENRAVVTLHIDGVAISGYILTASSQDVANEPRKAQFSFRMIVSDYIFEDDPIGTLNFFDSNLWANRGTDTTGQDKFVEFVGKVGDALTGQANTQGGAIVARSLNLAKDIVTQAIFGSPFAAMTQGVAQAASLYRQLANNANLDGDALLKSNIGSAVEFDGKPPALLPSERNLALLPGRKTTTLQQQGIDNLLASVDNSLAILLNLQTSPIIQAVTAVSSLIEGAITALGASNVQFATNSRQKFGSFQDRAGKRSTVIPVGQATLSGRYMGYDFIMPFNGLSVFSVNPSTEKSAGVEAAEAGEAVLAGAYGSSKDYDFATLPLITGSDIDFDALKRDPNYLLIPRAWRMLIEKYPEVASEKLVVGSRRNSSGDLVLLLRKSKTVVDIDSSILRRLEGA